MVGAVDGINWTLRGAMPADQEMFFEWLESSVELWVECVKNFHQ